jgi:hypothetical protein
MKAALFIIGCLALIASASMYYIGSNSGHLSELADLFWLPLPLGAICLIAGALKKDKPKEEA